MAKHNLPTNAPPHMLAAICPAGHALTLAQIERGGSCPICAAQAPIRR